MRICGPNVLQLLTISGSFYLFCVSSLPHPETLVLCFQVLALQSSSLPDPAAHPYGRSLFCCEESEVSCSLPLLTPYLPSDAVLGSLPASETAPMFSWATPLGL